MAKARVRTWCAVVVVGMAAAATLGGVGAGPAGAQVSAVKGSALGYLLNVSLFDGPVNTRGPAPTVTLPAGGASTALIGNEATASAVVGPATLFTSGPLAVSTQGTTASGSVTSSSKVDQVNRSGQEVLTATSVASTCTASASGVSASTTITGGVLETDSGDTDTENSIPDHPRTTLNVPSNPAPNTVVDGHLHVGNATDNFRFVFNEQVTNTDGSITVNAVHEYFLGSLAKGDLIIGQSVCGVTASAATTSTTASGATTSSTAPGATTTSTTASSTTTTTTAATTTTTVAATTTTAAAATTTTTSGSTTGVGGGAYGYFVTVALFGGAPGVRGPTPTVSLPAAGSQSPVTNTAATASAQFGPATLFSSGRLDVSTQGVPGGSVTSSAKVANVNSSGQEVLTATEISSSCVASSSGASGSVSISGGKLTTSEGANLDVDTDDTVVTLAANPAPNTTLTGKIETVGDTYRIVFNEQIRNADGSITVNAAHQFLLGPTAVGEVIIGQSRCGITAASTGGGGGQTGGGGGGLATTGGAIAVFVAVAMMLAVGGWTTVYWSAGVDWREGPRRRMPWPSRGVVR